MAYTERQYLNNSIEIETRQSKRTNCKLFIDPLDGEFSFGQYCVFLDTDTECSKQQIRTVYNQPLDNTFEICMCPMVVCIFWALALCVRGRSLPVTLTHLVFGKITVMCVKRSSCVAPRISTMLGDIKRAPREMEENAF